MIMPISGLIIIGYTLRDLWLLFRGQAVLAGEAVKEGHS
jgi:hypothetical protein